MKTASELLDELNATDEATGIEAKKASEIGKSIVETVCAFANEPGLGGGYLLLGVEQTGTLFEPQYTASGLTNPDKIQSDLASQCATMLNRPVRPQISVEQVGGKSVVVAYVPEAAATDKPIYVRSLGQPRGAFRRIGPSDHHGTDDDLVVLGAGHQRDTYDATAVPDGRIDDLDAAVLADYRALRAKVNPDAEELSWDNAELLRALRCTVEIGGAVRPTVAGVLLFGTPMALRRCLPAMRIDYIRVPGREWVEDPHHRFDTIEIRSPLIAAVRKATNAVLDDLPKAFSLPADDIQSTESPLLPNRVIREAVVNAVMHRSYRTHGSIQIIRYANRLEIRNHGHSLKPEEQLGQPGSATRNPLLAAVLHEVNIAETKGSGIRVMRELMQQTNLSPPTFESSRRNDQFVATFLFHHFLGPEDLAWLGGLTAERLSDEEARALVFVRELGAINNAAYRDINRADTLQASTHLRRLRDLDLLAKKGAGNQTYYVPGAGFNVMDAAPEAPTPSPPAKSGTAEGQSHQFDEQSHQPGPQSHQSDEQSHRSDDPVSRSVFPSELRKRLPEAGQRPARDRLQDLIVDLCGFRPLTSRELAALLNRRQHKALIRDHLSPLIESGRLRYTIPEMPPHPQQKYIAGPMVGPGATAAPTPES